MGTTRSKATDWRSIAALALSSAVAAPTTLAAADDPPPVRAEPRPRRPPPTHGSARMTGRYQCAQGWTQLELELRFHADGAIEGTFDFFHPPTNVRGSYQLRGSRAGDGEITLSPVAWVRRPPGYVMVGMRGRIDGNGVFRGTITEPSCGAFIVAPQRG